jgi:hypothetical protein
MFAGVKRSRARSLLGPFVRQPRPRAANTTELCGNKNPRAYRPGAMGGPRLAQCSPDQCGRRGPDGILGPRTRVRHWPGWVTAALGSSCMSEIRRRHPPPPGDATPYPRHRAPGARRAPPSCPSSPATPPVGPAPIRALPAVTQQRHHRIEVAPGPRPHRRHNHRPTPRQLHQPLARGASSSRRRSRVG